MKTTTIRIAEEYGTDLSNRSRAALLRRQIEDVAARRQEVQLDFGGVRTVSDSFADELFAILVVAHGDDWFRRVVRVAHVTDRVRRSILTAIHARISNRVTIQ